MTAPPTMAGSQAERSRRWGNRLSTALYRRPRLVTVLLLGLPLLWLVTVYLGSLSTLILQSFYWLDSFTGQVVRTLTLANYVELTRPANVDIFVRTILMAAAVTLTCAVLAFPLAYYIARYASDRARGLLYLAVLLPLWSSYLVRVYAWRLILAREGIASWFFGALQLDWLVEAALSLPVIGGPSLSVSFLGMWLVFVYVWLPYMVLPIEASLQRVPQSLLEASADLGARPRTTLRRVTLPLAVPGVMAGSIFTFSLTLGDFVVPYSLGNSSFFIGQAVLSLQGTAWNIPLAAAFTVGPMVVMGAYLLAAKRLGAFDAL
jgi:putative spermidine/putrescine transport system permease protein